MSTEDLTELVHERLDAIWPDEMRRRTGAGLQWGQLVATAAVEALEAAGALAPEREGQ